MSKQTRDPFFLLGTHLKKGCGIHSRGLPEINLPFLTIGCDTNGEWWMGVRSEGMNLPAYIDLDESDAISFLRTFTDLLIDPPAEAPVRHKLSELRAKAIQDAA